MKPLLTAEVLNKAEEVPIDGEKVLLRATKGADGETYWVFEENRLREYGEAKVILIDPLDWRADDGRRVAQVARW